MSNCPCRGCGNSVADDDSVVVCERCARELQLLLQIHGLRTEIGEYEALLELQQKRMMEATKAWQRSTGRAKVHPDLGDLLTWLMKRAEIFTKE